MHDLSIQVGSGISRDRYLINILSILGINCKSQMKFFLGNLSDYFIDLVRLIIYGENPFSAWRSHKVENRDSYIPEGGINNSAMKAKHSVGGPENCISTKMVN